MNTEIQFSIKLPSSNKFNNLIKTLSHTAFALCLLRIIVLPLTDCPMEGVVVGNFWQKDVALVAFHLVKTKFLTHTNDNFEYSTTNEHDLFLATERLCAT